MTIQRPDTPTTDGDVTGTAAPAAPTARPWRSAVDRSRRRFHLAVLVSTGAALTASLVHVPMRQEADGLAVLVAVQSLVVLLAVLVSDAVRPGLRVDALSLFTVWESFRGCWIPVVLQYVGPGDNFWYRLGSYDDALAVLGLGSASFFVVVVARALAGLGTSSWRRSRRRSGPPPVAPLELDAVPARTLILLGLVGLVLRFPSVGSVTRFLSGDVDGLHATGGLEGPLALAAVVLRPLLVIGLVLVVLRRRAEGRPWLVLLLPLAGAVVFALGSYGLNRGTPVYAALATTLVLVERSRGVLRLRALTAVVGAVGVVFVVVGSFRQVLWLDRTGLDAPEWGVAPVLQSLLGYGASPLLLASALPAHRTSNPFTPDTWALSFVSPLPGLGDARFANSSAVFNHVVYDRISAHDMLLPEWLHEYFVFGPLGLVVAGTVLGLLFALADVARRRTSTMLGAYAAATATLWVTQLGVTSVTVVEQNLVNFVAVPALLAVVSAARPAVRGTRAARAGVAGA